MSAIGIGLSSLFRCSFTGARVPPSQILRSILKWKCVSLPQRSLFTASSSHGWLIVHHKSVSPVSLPYSTSSHPEESKEDKEIKAKKASLVQRFKESYAIYGKLVIVIHGFTSCVWLGSAYLLAST